MAEDTDEEHSVPAIGVQELLERVPKYHTINCISKRNSGKSVIVSEIIQELIKSKRVEMVIVMSGSAWLNDEVYKFLPKSLLMPFSEDVLENIWQKQVKIPYHQRKHIMIVLDDCLATPEAIRNETVTKFICNGRHICTSFIISSQHTTALLSPMINANSDLILYSKLSRQQLENLSLSTTSLSKQDFIKISESCAGVDYSFMVIDNYINSKEPSDFLTIVRARPPIKDKKDNKMDK
jgi:hypothetical protein